MTELDEGAVATTLHRLLGRAGIRFSGLAVHRGALWLELPAEPLRLEEALVALAFAEGMELGAVVFILATSRLRVRVADYQRLLAGEIDVLEFFHTWEEL